jgi:ABC-type glycerol-3-phosphate transport system substrate-binding protein
MRHGVARVVVAATLTCGWGAQAAEVTLSCGPQELEFRLCEEAAAAWSAESGHTAHVVRAPEQSNQRYFAYLDLLARRDRGRDILQIDVTWPSALADQLVDLREHVTAAALSGHFPALVANDTVGGRLVAMPWLPMPACCTTAPTCSKSTTSRCPRLGPILPTRRCSSRRASALPATPISGAWCSRDRPMRA